MREMKFRAWDARSIKGRMIEVHSLQFNDWVNVNGDVPHALMQYTGLKDKNGKEIYEGDIVKDGWLKGLPPFVVEWKTIRADSDSSTWYPGTGFNVALDDDSPNSYEVIGNIYENPELLK